MKKFRVKLSGNVYQAEVEKVSDYLYRVRVDDNVIEVEVESEAVKAVKSISKPAKTQETGERVIQSMLPGTVTKILVSEREEVNAGDTLLILEAMKMENEIVAPASGKVKEIRVSEGQRVETGDVLVVLE